VLTVLTGMPVLKERMVTLAEMKNLIMNIVMTGMMVVCGMLM